MNRFCYFLNESVTSTFKNFLNGRTNITDQQLNIHINLSEIRYLGVPDITDYRVEFITQKSKTTDPIWRTGIIIINRFR